MPLISVIMPVYNAADFIEEAINSILCQTEADFELLIGEDGSTDNTLEIIQQYTDPRIRVWKNISNQGNLFTSNLLFENCKGKYITIQDADDYAAPQRFQLLLQAFENDPDLGMVGSNYQRVFEDKTPVCSGVLPLTDQKIKQQMEREVVPMLYASVMIKTEIVRKAGFFPNFFNRIGYADLDFLSRCAEICKTCNIPQVLYYYRQHSGSFNHFHNQKKNKDLILENMDQLIVQAHHRRLQGKSDYFLESDKKSMLQYLSGMYLKRAENAYWDSRFAEARENIRWALKANPMNRKAYRTFFFIFRKSLVRS